MARLEIHHHKGDLPDTVKFTGSVAIDSEAMGLNPHRDRLCVVQLSAGDGTAHVVQLNENFSYDCPNLKALLADNSITKIYHYGRFDIAILYHYLGVLTQPVYCTKIASKLVRNFTPRQGLKSLCSDLLGIELSKQSQSSDWGDPNLTKEQLAYAASDVLHLHALKEKLDSILKREGRLEMAQKCFDFLPTVARLDLLGYEDLQVFSHS
ncbi:MAG: ribonuclease D [Alphaproteobacteria bacterium]|nr:ribonuclease D [Alphaproteobacteria bacterium]NCQ66363.1 ribonuclease D [Alphaproteobacteria bacterium]NCT06849.1 ribonuclease D [Alphaproteobacteria bacterium]